MIYNHKTHLNYFLLFSYPGLLLVSLFLFSGSANGQNLRLDLKGETSFWESSKRSLPFWLYSNKNGKTDSQSSNWINEFSSNINFIRNKNFSLQAGVDLLARISSNNSLHFSQLYLQTKLYGFNITAGRFAKPIGLNSHNLSSGSLMVSNNATPIPKIQLSTDHFLNIPYTNKHVQYKAMFSHGWFENDRYISNAYLHQKYLYLRLNIGSFSGTGGMIHNVQWGGRHPTLGNLSNSLSNYLRVITGSMSSEIYSTAGNSIAAYEFGLSYDHEKYDLKLTRLFYLEDRVSTRFRSPWDGSWGLNLNFKDDNKFINSFLYEHINTKRQDAKLGEGEAFGRINYYNHYLYQSGWSYYDKIIGTPLFTYDNEEDKITNNIIVGHHIGLEGSTGANKYKALLTYTRNYGVNPDKFGHDEFDLNERRTDQYSFYLKVARDLPQVDNLSVNVSFAGDLGELYSNKLGIMVGLTWKDSFSF